MFNYSRFLLAIVIFYSCSEKNTTAESQTSNLKSSNPVFGTWRDTKDTSHVIQLTEKEWIDMYNGEVVSVSKIFYETKSIIGHNSRKIGERNFIKLEESENNFYNYHIYKCDSLNLKLLHMDSGLEMEMIRE